MHRLARPETRSVLRKHRFREAPRVLIPIVCLQNVYLQKRGQRRCVAIGVSRSDLLIHLQCFIAFTHRVQIACHGHLGCAHKLMLGVLRDKCLERLVRFSEFPLLALRFGEQDVRVGCGGRVRITSDYLLVLLRGIGARQRRRSSRSASIRIKPVTCECNTRQQNNQRSHDDWFFEPLPEKPGFQCDIARGRWRGWHKRRVVDQFEPGEVVLCHAKVSRASGTDPA